MNFTKIPRTAMSGLVLLVSAAAVLGLITFVLSEISLRADDTSVEVVSLVTEGQEVAVESNPQTLPEDTVPTSRIPDAQENSAPSVDSGQRAVFTLAGGCFWCSEAFLQETPGVIEAISGYAGGGSAEANYKAVSTGDTGHREAVQVTFDPARVSFDEVLNVYWSHINPVDAGGQFADRGFQYTTAIYYNSPEQQRLAEASKARLSESGLFPEAIATMILPYTTFYKAEEYHQDYYKKSSEHYERYKKASGRAGFVEENWAKEAALEFFESTE